ncbi:MAG: universal stress protein, partial [Polyangiaceae bacterium]|nr:universal stress protein [Polyangiaceae bacterium]
MVDIRTVLCPIDFSQGSSAATEYAIELAQKLGARVHLLHVYPLPMLAAPDGGLMVTPQTVAQMSEEAAQATKRIGEEWRQKGFEIETHVGDGAPHLEIVRTAERLHADLIVMGTHGRSGLAHFLIGSVAEKVVRSSPIPVLTVRL